MRKTHTLDAPSVTLTELNPENYMVHGGGTANQANIALFDSASTHTTKCFLSLKLETSLSKHVI